MSASFAFSIGFPLIDPLRSRTKMYSPLTPSISVSKDYAFTAANSASLRSRVQNLGMKETITEDPESVRPMV